MDKRCGSRAPKIECVIEEDIGKEGARTLFIALSPESGAAKRFSTELGLDEGKIRVKIEADDLSALRAALNSYIRWIGFGKNILKILGPKV